MENRKKPSSNGIFSRKKNNEKPTSFPRASFQVHEASYRYPLQNKPLDDNLNQLMNKIHEKLYKTFRNAQHHNSINPNGELEGISGYSVIEIE